MHEEDQVQPISPWPHCKVCSHDSCWPKPRLAVLRLFLAVVGEPNQDVISVPVSSQILFQVNGWVQCVFHASLQSYTAIFVVLSVGRGVTGRV